MQENEAAKEEGATQEHFIARRIVKEKHSENGSEGRKVQRWVCGHESSTQKWRRM